MVAVVVVLLSKHAPGIREASDGGNGLSSSVTGSAVTRGGGGGGGAFSNTGSLPAKAVGGSGGGGDGGRSGNNNDAGSAGTANTGGGGGARPNFASYAGGSRMGILRYPNTATIAVGAGLTASARR